MKGSVNSSEFKKARTAYPSKKSSNANSLIYRQINPQTYQLVSKSKPVRHLRDTQASKEHKSKYGEEERTNLSAAGSKKNSINQITKKSSKIDVSSYEVKDVYEKLGANWPQQGNDFDDTKQLAHLRKGAEQQELRIINKNDSVNSHQKTKIKFEVYSQAPLKIQKKLFTYQYIIGKGGFGKVWKVEHVKTRNQYAMKEMLKSIVMTKKSVQSVMNELVLLSQFNSPFIVNMHFAFQDRDTLFLVLDLMEGGDLRYHIGNRIFNQIQSKFFIACIVLGLQDLHASKIIHRDIKPENLVLDSRGYIRITDLGIARTYKANNSCDTSGTPGYMSPEVICRQNHSYVSDYFAVGVIAYELMTGKRPYNGRSRNEIRDSMLAKQIQIRNNEIPSNWSAESADFINKLIQRKPDHRLGNNSISEIMNHPWLEGVNWDKLRTKQIESPFVPMMKKNNFDQDEQITIEDEEEAQLIEKNALLLRRPQFQELFSAYYMNKSEKPEGDKNKRVISSIRKSQNEKDLKLNIFTNGDKSKNIYVQNMPTRKNVDYEVMPKAKDKIVAKYLDVVETANKEKRKNSASFVEKSFFKDFKY